MTETQAQSGPAAGATSPAEANEPIWPAAGSPEASGPGSAGAGASGAAKPAGSGATGRAAVGRATVPGDGGTSAEQSQSPGAPKFTRAPGMPPPPDVLVPAQSGAEGAASVSTPVSGAGFSATAPVVPGPAVARASVRATSSGGRGTAGLAAPPTAATARVSEAVRSARATAAGPGRGPRRARLHLKRIDPWSVMKFAFAVSLVLFVVAIVATAVLYLALDAMGVFASVNKALAEMVGATGGAKGGFKITAKAVIGGAAILGAVNVVLFTALATLSAFIYNVCADLVGGIELTLAEKD